MDDVHDVAEGGPVGHGDVAVAAVGGGNGFDAVKLAVVFFAREGGDHFVHEVVDIEEFHLDAAVVDLDGLVVGDVVAEGGDGAVVVGAAPLAEEVGEAIDQNAGTGLLPIGKHQVFAGFLALAIFAGAEAAGQSGLDGAADHHGAVVLILLQRIEQGGGETEVAGHELFGVLRTVDAGQVEDEVAVPAPCVQLFGRGFDVIFIDGLDGLWEVIPLGLAITDVLELGAEVAADKAAGAGDEDIHRKKGEGVSVFAPHHLVDDADVALDNLDDLGGDVLVHIVGHGQAVVAIAAQADGGIDGLEQRGLVDAGYNEAGFVDGFGALGAGADAHGGEGVADAGKETALFGQGTAVAHYREGVHLEAVVVVKTEGLVLDDAPIELEAAGGKAVAAAGVARVEDGHVVLLGHAVDGGEEAQEVFLGVDVFFAVGGEQDIAAFLQTEALVDVGGLDAVEVFVQHFGHGRAGDVGALFGQTAIGQVAAGVLAVGHVDVGDDIDNAAVGLFGEALVFTAVAGFHVEDGDVQALGTDDAQARVGVAEHEHGVGLRGGHQFVRGVDDVAAGGTKVVADGVHIDVGVGQAEVFEEHAVEVVVVVLSGMGQDNIEVAAGLVDDGGQADDFGACAHDDEQFEASVVAEVDVGVVGTEVHGENIELDGG